VVGASIADVSKRLHNELKHGVTPETPVESVERAAVASTIEAHVTVRAVVVRATMLVASEVAANAVRIPRPPP
jgi:hypothetical protein